MPRSSSEQSRRASRMNTFAPAGDRTGRERRAGTGRGRVRKVGGVENREVPVLKTGKGYELSKTPIVAVTEEELRQMPLHPWPP